MTGDHSTNDSWWRDNLVLRDLVARYNWSGDRGDLAGLIACFTPDGILDVGDHGGRWEGRVTIERELVAVAERTAAAGGSPGPVRHHVSNLLLTPDGPDAATGAAYFVVYTSIGTDHWGRYRDRYARAEGGAWLIAERTVRVDGSSHGSLMVR